MATEPNELIYRMPVVGSSVTDAGGDEWLITSIDIEPGEGREFVTLQHPDGYTRRITVGRFLYSEWNMKQ